MPSSPRLLPVLLTLLLASLLAPPASLSALPGPQEDGAEEEPTGEGEPTDEDGEEAEEETEPRDLITEAERVIRIEYIVDLDQEKLAELGEELGAYSGLFQSIAAAIVDANRSMTDLEAALEAPEETSEPGAKEELETSLERVRALDEVLRKLSGLVFTAESTTRQQIQALEKKLEREQRTLDELRGLTKVEDEVATQPAAPLAQAPAAPSGTSIPIMPGVSLPAPSSAAQASQAKAVSADQLEALRTLQRTESEVVEAEKALEEFVKRRESLLTQIQLEGKLLETSQDSAVLLREALTTFEREAAAEDLSEIVSDSMRVQPGTLKRVERLIESNDIDIQGRTDYLASLERRMESLADEELLVTAEVEARRQQAAAARKNLLWLESPLHPQNLFRWFTQRGPRVLLVIIVSALLLFLIRISARRTARAVMGTGRGTRAGRENRADTIGLSIQSASTLVIIVGGTLLVFQEAGVDIKTVLGGAAILGVAFAFGAQNMMRDYFSGFMILLEDQYGLGDLVTISGVTGRVETVNMRTTVLRDIEGRVHFIPNGDVKLVTNRTYEWGRAVLEVPISYHENVDRAMEVLVDVCRQMRKDEVWGEYLTDEPGMLGVDKFTEYGVVIKFMQETRPDKIFPVRRELLRRVKNRFDQEGIEIPVPQRTIYIPKDESGS